MEYIKNLLIQLLAVLVLFNICLVLVPKSIRNIAGKILRNITKLTCFIFNEVIKISIKHYKQESSNTKNCKRKGTTNKKAVGETATSNVIPFKQKQ